MSQRLGSGLAEIAARAHRGREPKAPRTHWPVVEYVDETPRRPRRSDIEIEAEEALGHAYVTLLSIERPAPRSFGDNHGYLPIWVEATADWRQSGVAFDRQQPAARAVRLAVLVVASSEHQKRLKTALDEALHGREKAEEAEALRHRFRNGVDFGPLEEWWTPLLVQAVETCLLAATAFQVFDRSEHERRVQAEVSRRLRAVLDR